MDAQKHLKRVCLEVSPILVTTIQRDGKMIPSMGVTSVQIRKIVKPVTERIWKEAPQVYHALPAMLKIFIIEVLYLYVAMSVTMKMTSQTVKVVIQIANQAVTLHT